MAYTWLSLSSCGYDRKEGYEHHQHSHPVHVSLLQLIKTARMCLDTLVRHHNLTHHMLLITRTTYAYLS